MLQYRNIASFLNNPVLSLKMFKTPKNCKLASLILFGINIDELTEKTREIISLQRQEAEKRYEESIPIIMEREAQINRITGDLLGERAFFEKIIVDYNNITAYDIGCIKVAIAEYLSEKMG